MLPSAVCIHACMHESLRSLILYIIMQIIAQSCMCVRQDKHVSDVYTYRLSYAIRPSHLKIRGGPIMTRAALRRRAIDGPCAVM